MSQGGIEVYLPKRLLADKEHEYLVADGLRQFYNQPVYVEYCRIPADHGLALCDNEVSPDILSKALALIALPY